jgi:hypothetical protein
MQFCSAGSAGLARLVGARLEDIALHLVYFDRSSITRHTNICPRCQYGTRATINAEGGAFARKGSRSAFSTFSFVLMHPSGTSLSFIKTAIFNVSTGTGVHIGIISIDLSFAFQTMAFYACSLYLEWSNIHGITLIAHGLALYWLERSTRTFKTESVTWLRLEQSSKTRNAFIDLANLAGCWRAYLTRHMFHFNKAVLTWSTSVCTMC